MNEETKGILIAFGIIGFIVLVLYLYDRDAKAKEEELKNARSKYDDVLASLKINPSDPDLRQKAVELGRVYSNLTRNRKGVTVYDEVALMNDISAACAAASQMGVQHFESPANIEQRLEKLLELKSKDLITEREFHDKRKSILDEV